MRYIAWVRPYIVLVHSFGETTLSLVSKFVGERYLIQTFRFCARASWTRRRRFELSSEVRSRLVRSSTPAQSYAFSIEENIVKRCAVTIASSRARCFTGNGIPA